jgi:hypothetical protein
MRAHYVLGLGLVLLAGCRKGSANTSSVFVAAAPAGTQGCASAGAVASATNVFASASFGPKSQIVAASGVADDTVYFTGRDGVFALALPAGSSPVETELVAPGQVRIEVLQPAGIDQAAELSGIAILDDAFLAVAEHTSNSLLLVQRAGPAAVLPLAGQRNSVGGFASGVGDGIRFHFGASVPLFADAAGGLFVGDTENQALRQVSLDASDPAVAITITGSGAAGSGVGSLLGTSLDTPSGLAASCGGDLLVVEAGLDGVGGNRLLRVHLAGASFFGGLDGATDVLAGDGTELTTQGAGTQAQLAHPKGLATDAGGRAYWVDATSLILRRYDFATGACDCPMFADCATALLSPSPFSGFHFSVAIGASGAIYVLDADSLGGTLWRVTP